MATFPKYLVYGLADPCDGRIRYVGKSSTGEARLSGHLSKARLGGRTHRDNWIRSLFAAGHEPDFEVLEAFENADDLSLAECFWIAQMKGLGADLTNHTNGGEGQNGRAVSAATRTKIGTANKGRACSEEHLRRLRSFATSSENAAHCRRLAASSAGRKMVPRSDAWRVSTARALGMRPFVDEQGNRFETLGEAARLYSITPIMVSRVLRGQRSHTRGHVFKFTEGI